MKLKFDKDSIKRHIDIFFEDNGRDPYMICAQRTYNMLPEPIAVNYMNTYEVLRNSINCDNKEEPPKPVYITWGAIKVFIDNDLPTGELILA